MGKCKAVLDFETVKKVGVKKAAVKKSPKKK